MNLYRKIKFVLGIVAFGLFIFIITCTVNVISITENPSWSIDFENKETIIVGYASLIGAILSFLSIIFVLFNIIQESHKYDEKIKLENKRDLEFLFDRIILVHNFIIEISEHLIKSGKKMKEYSDKEKSQPLFLNILNIYSNKQYYRFLEFDYNSVFRSFQTFKIEQNIKTFNDLYSIIDFYSDLLPEIKTNSQNHVNIKYQNKLKVKEDINVILDLASDITNNIKLSRDNNIEKNELYKLVDNLIHEYYDLIKNDEKEMKETDFLELSNSFFFKYLKNYISLDSTYRTNDSEILMNKISKLRKDIHSIHINAINESKHIDELRNRYFTEESEIFKKIDTIKVRLNNTIRNKNIDELLID